jgi:hypothetical protein
VHKEIGFLTRIALDTSLIRRMLASQYSNKGKTPGGGSGGGMDRGGYGGYGHMNSFRAGIDLLRGGHGLGTSIGSGKVLASALLYLAALVSPAVGLGVQGKQALLARREARREARRRQELVARLQDWQATQSQSQSQPPQL